MTAPTTLLVVGLLAALPACFASRRVHPRSAEELRRGYGWVSSGDLERAEVAFSHALEFDPDLVEAESGLGVVARTRGDLAGALRHFDRALAADGSFAEGHANRGEALLAANELGAAERALRSALALNPDLIEARLNLGRSLLRRGLGEPDRRAELWARSRDAYLHVLETDPARAAAHAELAFMDFLSARLTRAEAGWTRAAELAPKDPEAAHGLCLARAAQGRCQEAILECERCLRLAPGHAACERSLGAALACAEPGIPSPLPH
jgi:tetratricopeptide (TPR) repeat protein